MEGGAGGAGLEASDLAAAADDVVVQEREVAYLEERFGTWARLYASGCFLLMQSARSGVILFLLAILLSNVLGVGCVPIIVVTAVATMAYSMMGGITAVVWTDAIQAIILIAGALLCAVLIYCGLPGGIVNALSDAWSAGKFSLGSLSVTDLGSETLMVAFLYGLCINLLTFGCDQCFTQRYQTAKDMKGAIRSMAGGYLLYVPVTLLFVVIGTGLWLFVQKNPEVVPEAQTPPESEPESESEVKESAGTESEEDGTI